MGHTLLSMKNLFVTPLAIIRIDDHERLNTQLLEEIAERRRSEEGVSKTNRSGWHSKVDLFARKEPAHRELAQAIIRAAADVAGRLAADKERLKQLKIECHGWVNANPQGAYNVPHEHSSAFLSGSYYVSIPPAPKANTNKSGGAIEFIDPRSAPAGQGLIGTKVFSGSHTVRPQEGTLLIFPSTVKHWVHPNPSPEERITVAFNAHIRTRDDRD